MNCPHCGIIIEDKWAFCPKCANGLGDINQPQQREIQRSEDDIKTQYITMTSDKSRKEAMTFCLVGLALTVFGLFSHIYLLALIGGGLHRFYVGKMFSGAFYAITGGLFCVGLIFDLIQLNTGQFTDNVGQPLRR